MFTLATVTCQGERCKGKIYVEKIDTNNPNGFGQMALALTAHFINTGHTANLMNVQSSIDISVSQGPQGTVNVMATNPPPN